MVRWLFVAAMVAAPFDSAASQSQGLLVLTGQCTKLIIAGSNRTSSCLSRVGSETYGDGTVVFTFRAKDTVLAFVGSGPGLGPRKGDAFLPVSSVGLQIDGSGRAPFRAAARGTCRFTDPWKGKPATVSCSAAIAKESFSATFRSDGAPPMAR